MPAAKKKTQEPVVEELQEEVIEEELTNQQRLEEVVLILKGIDAEKKDRIELVKNQVERLQTQLEAQLASLDKLKETYTEKQKVLAELVEKEAKR